MNNLLVFHHSDLDGMGVKLLGMLYARSKGWDVETYSCEYGNIDQIISERLQNPEDFREIVIGDISIQSKELADWLDEINYTNPVHLLDHHISARWLNIYDWAFVQEKDSTGILRCGTYWTAQKLFGEPFLGDYPALREFVELVDLYDTWKWRDEFGTPYTPADDLNSLFKMLGEKRFTDYMMECFLGEEPLFHGYSQELIALRAEKLNNKAKYLEKTMKKCLLKFNIPSTGEMADEIRKYYEDKDPSGLEALQEKDSKRFTTQFKVGLVFTDGDISDLGHRILGDNPDLDFLLFVSMPRFISLRSANELIVPLSVVAKYLTGKGGGHPCSAGGSLHPKASWKATKELFPNHKNRIFIRLD